MKKQILTTDIVLEFLEYMQEDHNHDIINLQRKVIDDLRKV